MDLENAETTSTAALVRGLSETQRNEAVELAARLQDGERRRHEERYDDAALVAAVHEAGIEDRFLREAIGQVRGAGKTTVASEPTGSTARFVAFAVVLALFVGAQFLSGAATFHLEGGNHALAFLLAPVLGALTPGRRGKWLAPTVVLGVGLLVAALYGLVPMLSGSAVLDSARTYWPRIVGTEMALALFGALLVDGIVHLTTSRRKRNAASSDPEVR